MKSATTSVRLPLELKGKLERTAKHLRKNKTWIVVQALEQYLQDKDREALAAEARRQSLLSNLATDSYDAQLEDWPDWK
jgi:predicted DNA-binding protein